MDITQVYNDNKNSVYRLALTYLHSSAEAEDVCHDVFIKMIERKISIFPGKERAWLLTVTANECKNRLRFWKRHENEELSDSIPVKDTGTLNILETVMSLPVKERNGLLPMCKTQDGEYYVCTFGDTGMYLWHINGSKEEMK